MTELAEQTMSYEGLVAAGRAAREQADNMQWVEGDLSLQVETLPGDERPRDPETGLFIEDEAKTLKRYAEDIGMSYATLKNYRVTAAAWPSDLRRTEVSWHVHKTLSAQEDRFDLIQPGMTVREAEGIVGKRRAGTSRSAPGWLELLGQVGDALKGAEKAMDKIEGAVEGKDITNPKLFAKADEYAAWAEALCVRLRKLGED